MYLKVYCVPEIQLQINTVYSCPTLLSRLILLRPNITILFPVALVSLLDQCISSPAKHTSSMNSLLILIRTFQALPSHVVIQGKLTDTTTKMQINLKKKRCQHTVRATQVWEVIFYIKTQPWNKHSSLTGIYKIQCFAFI